MKYQSQRLRLREFQADDFPLFYSVFSNTPVMQYAWIDQYTRESDAEPHFQKILLHNQLPPEIRPAYEFAVFLNDSDTFIGYADIEVHIRNSSGGVGEIGYFLLPEFWGQGYATEISQKLTEICFTKLCLHRVEARCHANNQKSEQVMKKCGMTKEGEFRKVRYKNEHWDDELHYSILIEEWQYSNKTE